MLVYEPFPCVVLQEVPGEISLGFMVAGCKIGCAECSYKTLKDKRELSLTEYEAILNQHLGLATCVLFMGGEWVPGFDAYLAVARATGFKTCLYSGLEITDIKAEIVANLDYCKTGKWLGVPLSAKGTNQRFLSLPDLTDLTSLFFRRV